MFEDFTFYEMNHMFDRFERCRKKTPIELARLNVTHPSELSDWITPIERENMLKEILIRGVIYEDEIERDYHRHLNI